MKQCRSPSCLEEKSGSGPPSTGRVSAGDGKAEGGRWELPDTPYRISRSLSTAPMGQPCFQGGNRGRTLTHVILQMVRHLQSQTGKCRGLESLPHRA